MPKQQSFDFIHREANGAIIDQRSNDGYVNATQLCKVANKRWHNYLRNETTGHFLRALATKTRISVLLLNQEVIDSDGVKSTWVHPKVAVHLAQWLSADFAVQVSEWVFEWMSAGKVSKQPATMPYHLQRHMDNLHKIPPSHFSVLQEMSMTLIGPLEVHGYSLPENMVPDISQGKMFCGFLRKQDLINPSELPTYQHSFPDGRTVDAKLYPIELLGAFRKFIAETWMPERSESYFKDRDPLALPYLNKVLRLEPPANSMRFKRIG